tara:strand:- start:51 stop:1157 length:1107 start_codon:yes stop_codon:yes gene_type:complete
MSSELYKNNVVIDEKRLNGWTVEHENVFIEWSDKAMCYRWLHSKSYKNYSFRNAWYTIPVIVMSTITGTANFAQERFPPEYKVMAQMLIGGINILAGILTTIQQFLKITELNEGHRVSAISWGKFVRNVTVILAKSPLERENTPIELLNRYKEEFDRLMEVSPDIEDKVIINFKQVIYNKEKDDENGCFDHLMNYICCVGGTDAPSPRNSEITGLQTMQSVSSSKTTPGSPTSGVPMRSSNSPDGSTDGLSLDDFAKDLKKKYKFKKPEICGEFVSVAENRHPWYKQDKVETPIFVEPVVEIPVKHEFDYAPYVKKVNEKIERFKAVRGREPLIAEIRNNMHGEIDDVILNHVLTMLFGQLDFAANKV